MKYDDNGRTVINEMKRVSKPGRRIYKGKDDIKRRITSYNVCYTKLLRTTHRGIADTCQRI